MNIPATKENGSGTRLSFIHHLINHHIRAFHDSDIVIVVTINSHILAPLPLIHVYVTSLLITLRK